MSEDTELLERLARSLAPAYREPPPDGLLALQRAVCELQTAGSGGNRRWWRKRWIAAVGGGVFVLGGSGVAFAAGAPMPAPVRALASDVGLPVTPPALNTLHHDESQLNTLLHQPQPDPQATARAVSALQSQLDGLNAADRQAAGSEPTKLLTESRNVLQYRHSSAAGYYCAQGAGSGTGGGSRVDSGNSVQTAGDHQSCGAGSRPQGNSGSAVEGTTSGSGSGSAGQGTYAGHGSNGEGTGYGSGSGGNGTKYPNGTQPSGSGAGPGTGGPGTAGGRSGSGGTGQGGRGTGGSGSTGRENTGSGSTGSGSAGGGTVEGGTTGGSTGTGAVNSGSAVTGAQNGDTGAGGSAPHVRSVTSYPLRGAFDGQTSRLVPGS